MLCCDCIWTLWFVVYVWKSRESENVTGWAGWAKVGAVGESEIRFLSEQEVTCGTVSVETSGQTVQKQAEPVK